MTQPHYIDREVVALVIDDLTHGPRAGCADGDGWEDIADRAVKVIEALSRPMEAVAWREAVAREVCRIVRTWQGFKATPEYTLEMEVENAWDDWLPEAARILQALAVIPTQGGEGRETKGPGT